MTEPRRARAITKLVALASLSAALATCTTFDGAAPSGAYLDLAAASRACAQIFSCPGLGPSLRQSLSIPIDDADFSGCVTWLAGPSPTPPGGFDALAKTLDAVGAATSCEAALAGLDVRALSDGDPICGGDVADQCTSGGDLVDCHARRQIRCTSPAFGPGSTCRLNKAGEGRCSPTPTPCIAAARPLECSGSTLSACEPGVNLKQELACAGAHTSCVTSTETVGPLGKTTVSLCTNEAAPSPDSDCAGATEDGFTACRPDGSAVVLCNHVAVVSGASYVGLEVAFACDHGELHWSCQAGPGAVPTCVRPDAECALGDPDVNRCDGDSLSACVASRRVTLDCAAAGGGCETIGGSGRCRRR